jgi:hypothetical protein
MRPPTIKSVLAEINAVRTGRYGLPPLERMPRGDSSGYNCPIHNAFLELQPKYAGERSISFRQAPSFTYSERLRLFVSAFDYNGAYPSLRERDQNV